jgi:hypothetical protein
VWVVSVVASTSERFATIDVGPTPYFIEFFDQTARTNAGSCGVGAVCSISVSLPIAITHTFVAYVASYSASYPPANIVTTSNAVALMWFVGVAVLYYWQYAGQVTQNNDCGAATVAMTLSKYSLGPGGYVSALGSALSQIRTASQTPGSRDMLDSNIETALSFYHAHYLSIARGAAIQSEIQQIEAEIALGRPVIVLIHGAQLNRILPNRDYGDHWVVMTGFSNDNQTVYLNDPDLRLPKQLAKLPSNWINGGQISLSMAIFQAAFINVQPLNQTQVSIAV